jgi:GPH family glycoside/pentoside/hexuronide:cation symporter
MANTTENISKLDNWQEWHESKKSMLSFNVGSFAIELVQNAFAGLYFFFYETELLLPGIFLLLANVLFAIWNAVNDPLLGYLIEKPRKYWNKWGKRFPWLTISLFPVYICYFLLFAPPRGLGHVALFLWMFVMLAIADTFYSIFHISWAAMFPEKFRNDDARRKANVYKLIFGILSIIVGFLIPPQIYEFDNIASYALMGGVMAVIGCVAGILVIPGVREDPARKAQEIAAGRVKQTPFFESLKIGIHNKAFLAYLILYFSSKTWDIFVLGSTPYYAKWILGVPANELTFIYIAVILGVFSAVPVFTAISKKIGFRKTAVIGGLTEAFCTIPLLFVRDATTSLIFFFIVGFGNGAMWVMFSPILSEALDSISVETGKRDSSVFVGINVFFGRLTIIIFTVLVVYIHAVTNFNPAAEVGKGMQNPLADLGILFTIAVIPVISTAIGSLLFWKLYDIKGEKKIWLEEQLRAKDLHK